MAEPLSAPFVMLDLTLATIAAAAKLRDLLKSFHSYRLHNLLQELDTLNGALGSLRDTIEATSDTDFSALNIPLQRCGEACLNFEEEVLLCLARTGDNRTSFRDWVKIKYMGEDIDSFKELLASYRLTISIAITDAKLRRNSAPAENIASFNDLIVTAKANLERRLKNIDERLEVALTMDVAATERTAREAQLIKEERLSTEKCLQISAEVSDHIAQIQLATNNCSAQETSVSTNELPEQIMREGLQECRDTLARTASRLEEHEKQLFARLLDEPRTMIPSEEDRVNLARMRDDWEAIRRSMDICSFAVEHAHHNCNTNNMWATDDAIQIMVCTGAKTIHGVNRGGWRTRQIGGYVDQDVLEGIFKALSSMAPSLPVEGAT
ncbi:hypothetical protein M409DRAFT_69640 [Zasmidium cellare ATCC 36951]|uniref:Azaphilone pigments biosynthesis cluster protein L N-terminal domain-containing protein n=1 Tax=Zasmidium cellare ATCC 36951 TaxID=1080233 RepID=A0A6A6C325_ZASCE|nr:uncharacterized protein M409DRAFT_69640 [Zasmidium cellare ATCC 36951]KAF2161514.1 hypothetical protein M409DRAFT_69640 [Zasmidium cellare ATCC 36951]